MATMMVIVTESVPPKLRGRLALWLVEVRAGVYVGHYSSRTRERLWNECCRYYRPGNVVMIWKTPTESQFSFRTLGENRRVPSDHDSIQLVRFLPPYDETNAQQELLLEDEPLIGIDTEFIDKATDTTGTPAPDSSHDEYDEASEFSTDVEAYFDHVYNEDWDDD